MEPSTATSTVDIEDGLRETNSEETRDHVSSEIEKKQPASPSPRDSADRPRREITGIRWALVIVAIFSTNFLFALDNTIVANIQPSIINDLGEINKLPWISVGFPLAAAATNFLWGRIYGQVNVKWLYIASVIMFEVGSVLCGAASSMNMLICGRVLGGLGCQGMYLGVMTFIGAFTTDRERPLYLAIGGLVWAVGIVVGPVIGAAFASSNATWRWSFYINLCIGALFAPVYLWLLPSLSFATGGAILSRLAGIDFLGATLLGATTTLGILAIDFGGIVFPWSSATIIAFFVVSGTLCLLLGLQQHLKLFTTSSSRILPLHLCKSVESLVLCLQTAAATTAGIVPIYFLPLYFQFVQGSSPIASAVHILPLIAFMVVSCLLSGGMLSKGGRYMPFFAVGGIFTIIGSALMYNTHADSSTATVYGYSIFLGFGAGLTMQLAFSVVQAKVAAADLPLVTSLIAQAQVGGLTISLAIGNALFLNQAANRVSDLIPDAPPDEIQALINGLSGEAITSLPALQHQLVLNALVDAMRNVYLLVLVYGGLMLLSSGLLKKGRLGDSSH